MKTTPFHERPEIRIAREARAKLTLEEYQAIVYVIKKGIRTTTREARARAKLNKIPEQLAKERDAKLKQVIKRHKEAFSAFQREREQERIANESHAATN